MIVKFRPLPVPWGSGTQHQVVIEITGGPPGQSVNVTLHQTMPAPEQQLGSQSVLTTSSGDASVIFPVNLSSLGINVLHCEAIRGSSHDSDSAGTIVQ